MGKQMAASTSATHTMWVHEHKNDKCVGQIGGIGIILIYRSKTTYICLYDDQVPCYLLIVQSFSENYGAKKCQGDVKGSVCCLKHTFVTHTIIFLIRLPRISISYKEHGLVM